MRMTEDLVDDIGDKTQPPAAVHKTGEQVANLLPCCHTRETMVWQFHLFRGHPLFLNPLKSSLNAI